MRTQLAGVLMLLFANSLVAAESDRFADVSAKDKATWHLAVHTAARRALETVNELPKPESETLSQMQSHLTDAILADIQRHSRRDKSFARCREVLRQQLQTAHTNSLERIVEVANEQSRVPILLPEVMHVAGERYQNALQQALDAFDKQHAKPLFESARSTAVAVDRQSVDRRVAPPPYDTLDSLLTEVAGKSATLPVNWSSETAKQLRQALQPYAGRTDAPVLEEVADYADGIANRMIETIRQQHERQLNIANKHLTDDANDSARTAVAIADDAKKAVEAYLTTKREQQTSDESALPVYPVFSVVINHIQNQADEIEIQRFARFINNTGLLEVDAEALRGLIKSDLAAHSNIKKSRKLVLSSLVNARRPKLVSAYLEKAPDREVAVARFNKLLTEESELKTAVHTRLGDQVDSLLPDIRNQLAEEQYAASGLNIIESIATLPDELINKVHQSRGAKKKTLKDAVLFLHSGKLLESTDIPKDLLEEAQLRARDSVNALIDTAHRTVNGQLDLLQGIESDKRDKLAEDVQAGRELPAIRSEWESALQQQWQRLASEMASPYDALTPPVVTMLDKNIRQLYDSIRSEQQQQSQIVQQSPSTVDSPESQEPADVTQQEPPKVEERMIKPTESSGETTEEAAEGGGSGAASGGSGDGMSDRPLPDVLLVLTGDEADRCNAEISINELGVTISQELEVSDPTIAADTLFNQLAPHLSALHQEAVSQQRDKRGFFGFLKRSSAPSISVHVVVDSNAVRHRMSLLLKRQIEEAMLAIQEQENQDGEPVTIEWEAGLSE